MSLNKNNSYKYVGLSSEMSIGKSKPVSIDDAKFLNSYLTFKKEI
ncbi:MAG TPA: hypothetical protein VFK40_10745 [Nitrososphaeraceae archaeon]|nr:hypothetical protein [Nitrososphaeraceae archaeon]